MAELEGCAHQITIANLDSECVAIRLSGEIDVASAQKLRAAIQPVLDGAPQRVEFDLENVKFMDSSGIALLLTVADAIADVRILRLSAPARRVIELTGLESFLHVNDDRGSAPAL